MAEPKSPLYDPTRRREARLLHLLTPIDTDAEGRMSQADQGPPPSPPKDAGTREEPDQPDR